MNINKSQACARGFNCLLEAHDLLHYHLLTGMYILTATILQNGSCTHNATQLLMCGIGNWPSNPINIRRNNSVVFNHGVEGLYPANFYRVWFCPLRLSWPLTPKNKPCLKTFHSVISRGLTSTSNMGHDTLVSSNSLFMNIHHRFSSIWCRNE
jgi:hypothetical protein